MMTGPGRTADISSVFVVVGSLAYPPLVYFGLDALPSVAISSLALALMATRAQAARRSLGRATSLAVLFAAAALVALLLALDKRLALKAYPILVSLAMAAAFALSLVHPPAAIERIARLKEPNLSSTQIAYTRALTAVWVGFLLANAVTAAAIAVWGSLGLWTLYTGLISYLLMGVLFGGELLLRRRLLARIQTP